MWGSAPALPILAPPEGAAGAKRPLPQPATVGDIAIAAARLKAAAGVALSAVAADLGSGAVTHPLALATLAAIALTHRGTTLAWASHAGSALACAGRHRALVLLLLHLVDRCIGIGGTAAQRQWQRYRGLYSRADGENGSRHRRRKQDSHGLTPHWL